MADREGVDVAEGRPSIPRALERDVKVEAGYRCAIPTCRATVGLQIHHIVDYAKVKEHTFDNLILLCANCHARVTAKEIDTLAVRQFKANLSVVMQRYGDLERRVLELFAQHADVARIVLPGGQQLLLSYLLRDGLLVALPPDGPPATVIMGIPAIEVYGITPSGRDFVSRWVTARDLE